MVKQITSVRSGGRRRFLRAASAAAALLLPIWTRGAREIAVTSPAPPAPDAWLRIGTDDTVTVLIGQTEMGQGISTGLAQVLCEELEAEFGKVRFEFATGRPEYFNRSLLPTDQVTGGSRSMQAFYDPMRRAGAAAREMLLAAAATRWNVPVAECKARNGLVIHSRTRRRLSFGALAAEAARRAPPQQPPLKPRSEFRVVGLGLSRLDTPEKCNGSAVFGIDVQVPGMAHAAIRHAPVFGAEIERYTESAALAQPGVIAVLPVPGGIATVAEQYWQAVKALASVEVTFTPTARDQYSSADLERALAASLDADRAPTMPALGDVGAALASARTTASADYRAPYLAHATLEPINATASVTADGCEIWAPTQAPTSAQRAAAAVLGIEASRVRVNLLHAGGGFGRKGHPDAVTQAVLLSRAVSRPVKVIWSREEDTQQDFYRPACAARFSAALDASGKPTALRARVAGSGPLIFNRPQLVKDGLDPMAVTGISDLPYRIDNRLIESVEVPPPVRVGFWRGTSNSQNTFFIESFIDELAHAAAEDPLAFRRRLLAHDKRATAVLLLLAHRAQWDEPQRGRYLGMSYFQAARWKTRVGIAAEVSRRDEAVHLERLVCVADSGLVVNPNLAQAQLEGAMLFGLNAALYGEITLDRGGVEQSNFHDYPILRIGETPALEAFTIEGDEQPGSLGEIGVPAVAPALANAVFAATRKRIRALPLAKHVSFA